MTSELMRHRAAAEQAQRENQEMQDRITQLEVVLLSGDQALTLSGDASFRFQRPNPSGGA